MNIAKGVNAMNKTLRNLILASCLLAPVAQADDMGVCKHLDMDANNNISMSLPDFRIFNDSLVLRDDDGEELLVITREGVLRYQGKELELTPHTRALALAYYENAQLATAEFAQLGMSAAKIGLSAVGEAFARLFTGRFDEQAFEEKIENKARDLEARANAGCTYLEDIRRIELELAAELPDFEPVLFRKRALR